MIDLVRVVPLGRGQPSEGDLPGCTTRLDGHDESTASRGEQFLAAGGRWKDLINQVGLALPCDVYLEEVAVLARVSRVPTDAVVAWGDFHRIGDL